MFRISKLILFLPLFCVSSHVEGLVKQQGPPAMSQLSQTGKHKIAPKPCKIYILSLPEISACLCRKLSTTYASSSRGSRWSRLGQVPHCALSPSFDLQDGMLIFPSIHPGQEFRDVRRRSKWRTPQNPEVRRMNTEVEKIPTCPKWRMLEMPARKGAKVFTSSFSRVHSSYKPGGKFTGHLGN